MSVVVRLLPALAGVLLVASCSSGRIPAPVATDTPLPRADPAAAGLDTTLIEDVRRTIAAEPDHKIHSMLILKGGRIVYEDYYGGYGPENPHDLRSATKSITSLLTGIAIEDGILGGVDAPLMATLSDAYPDIDGRDDLTVRHALTMSTGLDCDDWDRSTRGQEDRMYRSRDWTRYFLFNERAYAPGDTTRYCTGGVVALGEAIAQGAGEDFATFAQRALFEPLGIRNLRWSRYDDDQKVDTGGHLYLTPQAMAKIGLLVLQDGHWRGTQVVPADWIEASTQAHARLANAGYGYLWWRNDFEMEGAPVEVIYAQGNGGQLIFVVPRFELVAVFTGGYYNSADVEVIYRIFYNAILPSAAGG